MDDFGLLTRIKYLQDERKWTIMARPRKVKNPEVEATQAAAVETAETVETVGAAETVEAVEPKVEDIQTEEKVAESTQEEPKKRRGRAPKKEKETAKKEPAKRRASRKQTAEKETVAAEAVKTEAAEEDTKSAAKPAARKAVQQCSLYVQYAGRSLSEEDLVKIAKDIWKYDLKRKVGELKNLELYVKPEENKVYYVMNKEFTGSFDI